MERRQAGLASAFACNGTGCTCGCSIRKPDSCCANICQLCRTMHSRRSETAVRRILGVLSLARKYGAAAVEEACSAAVELDVYEYRFVRRYLERTPAAPVSLRQVDPL